MARRNSTPRPGLSKQQLVAAGPLGAPIADAEVELSGGAPAMTVRTDAFGHAELRWTVEPDMQGQTILAELTTRKGDKASGHPAAFLSEFRRSRRADRLVCYH